MPRREIKPGDIYLEGNSLILLVVSERCGDVDDPEKYRIVWFDPEDENYNCRYSEDGLLENTGNLSSKRFKYLGTIDLDTARTMLMFARKLVNDENS